MSRGFQKRVIEYLKRGSTFTKDVKLASELKLILMSRKTFHCVLYFVNTLLFSVSFTTDVKLASELKLILVSRKTFYFHVKKSIRLCSLLSVLCVKEIFTLEM